MTIADLKRIVLQPAAQSEAEDSPEMEWLKTLVQQKPFYITNEKVHEIRRKNLKGQCCFWHIMGGPLREPDGFEMPVLPYQRLLLQILNEKKALAIKKSRGIGASTFFIYWCIYKALHDFKPGDRIIFTVGSRINLAEDILLRLKRVFVRKFPAIYNELLQQSTTKAIIGGVIVEAFPSHSISLRGYDRVKIIVIEEGDYYKKEEAKQIRASAEGFVGKPSSDPWIILISTPNAPGGVLETIEKEKDSLYWFMPLTYEYGLEGPYPIYSQEQLSRARKSPEWRREYCGEYLGQVGDVVSPLAIQRCIDLGKEMDKTAPIDDWSIPTQYVMGIDPGYGSSNTALENYIF